MTTPGGLAGLLEPESPDAFAATMWGRRATVLAGAPDRFAGLIASADIDRILRFVRPAPPQQMMLVQGSRHYGVNWTNPDGSPRSEMVRRAWLDGYSIVLNDVARYWEPVARYCAELQRDLHHPVDANLYYTPPGTQGFDPHFDIMDVFVLQLEGTKHWDLWGEARAAPLADEHAAIDPARLPEPQWSGELRPGEALYIPRGHVHAARATDMASLHLTIGVKVVTWLDLVMAAIDDARRDPRFREALPPGFLGEAAPLRTAMAERTEAVPHFLTAEAGIAGLARKLLGESPLPRDDLLAAPPALDLDTRLERRAGIVCTAGGTADGARLHYSGGVLAGPAKIAPAIECVVARTEWSPRELPGPLRDGERLVLAQRLLREGVVQRVAAG